MDKERLKQTGILLIAIVFLVIVLAAAMSAGTKQQPFLRIHIRANSNTFDDQSVKYEIKEAVVSYLTPIVSECVSKADALTAVDNALPTLAAIANKVLKSRGHNYTASTSLKKEEFPDRDYDGITLPAGIYDALIIELGTALGDNWWCVVYPPYCFQNASATASDGITYKSKIAEIIEGFRK